MCTALIEGTYSVREHVLTCLQSMCVCFMCISEGVCQGMYILGLDFRIKLELRLVPGSEMPSITPIHCQAPKEEGGS